MGSAILKQLLPSFLFLFFPQIRQASLACDIMAWILFENTHSSNQAALESVWNIALIKSWTRTFKNYFFNDCLKIDFFKMHLIEQLILDDITDLMCANF